MMRNDFYPTSKAEYMTRERFKELGLTKADIGVRDFAFGVQRVFEDENIEDAVEHVAGYTSNTHTDSQDAAPTIEAPPADPNHYLPAMEVEQLPVCLSILCISLCSLVDVGCVQPANSQHSPTVL